MIRFIFLSRRRQKRFQIPLGMVLLTPEEEKSRFLTIQRVELSEDSAFYRGTPIVAEHRLIQELNLSKSQIFTR